LANPRQDEREARRTHVEEVGGIHEPFAYTIFTPMPYHSPFVLHKDLAIFWYYLTSDSYAYIEADIANV
jgi:hypothetical protein